MKPAKFRDVDRFLRKLGYELDRVDGSHHIYDKPGSPSGISVPKDSSGEVSPGVMRNVLRALGLREADFKRLK